MTLKLKAGFQPYIIILLICDLVQDIAVVPLLVILPVLESQVRDKLWSTTYLQVAPLTPVEREYTSF